MTRTTAPTEAGAVASLAAPDKARRIPEERQEQRPDRTPLTVPVLAGALAAFLLAVYALRRWFNR